MSELHTNSHTTTGLSKDIILLGFVEGPFLLQPKKKFRQGKNSFSILFLKYFNWISQIKYFRKACLYG